MSNLAARASQAVKNTVGFGSNSNPLAQSYGSSSHAASGDKGSAKTTDTDFATIQNNVLRLEETIDKTKKNLQFYVNHYRQVWKYQLDVSHDLNALYASDAQHRLTTLVERYEQIHTNIDGPKMELLEKLIRDNVYTKIDKFKENLNETKKLVKQRYELRQKYDHYYSKLTSLRADREKSNARSKQVSNKDSDRLQRNETKYEQAKKEFVAINKQVAKRLWEHWRRRYEVLDPLFNEIVRTEAQFISAINNQFGTILPDLKAAMQLPIRIDHEAPGDIDGGTASRRQTKPKSHFAAFDDSDDVAAAAAAADDVNGMDDINGAMASVSVQGKQASTDPFGTANDNADDDDLDAPANKHRRQQSAAGTKKTSPPTAAKKKAARKAKVADSSDSSETSSDDSDGEFPGTSTARRASRASAAAATLGKPPTKQKSGKSNRKQTTSLFDESFLDAPTVAQPANNNVDLFTALSSDAATSSQKNQGFNAAFDAFDSMPAASPQSAPLYNQPAPQQHRAPSMNAFEFGQQQQQIYGSNPYQQQQQQQQPQYHQQHQQYQSNQYQQPPQAYNSDPFSTAPPQSQQQQPFPALMPAPSQSYGGNGYGAGNGFSSSQPQQQQQPSQQLALMPAQSAQAGPPESVFDDLMATIETQNAQALGQTTPSSSQPQASPASASYGYHNPTPTSMYGQQPTPTSVYGQQPSSASFQQPPNFSRPPSSASTNPFGGTQPPHSRQPSSMQSPFDSIDNGMTSMSTPSSQPPRQQSYGAAYGQPPLPPQSYTPTSVGDAASPYNHQPASAYNQHQQQQGSQFSSGQPVRAYPMPFAQQPTQSSPPRHQPPAQQHAPQPSPGDAFGSLIAPSQSAPSDPFSSHQQAPATQISSHPPISSQQVPQAVFDEFNWD